LYGFPSTKYGQRRSGGYGPEEEKYGLIDLACADTRQPTLGLGEIGFGGRAGAQGRVGLGGPTAARVAAEETHITADSADSHECLSHTCVGDMSFGVDGKTVVAERIAGGSGLQTGQVHPAHGELVEQFDQGTGVVIGDERDDRGPIGPRGWGQCAEAGQLDEAGGGVGTVADTVGECVQTVPFPGDD